jgi:hypothetical protein
MSKELKRVANVIGKAEKWYPDLSKADLKQMLNTEIVILDARVIDSFDTEYGTHDLAQFKGHLLSDHEKKDVTDFTFISSGEVIVKKTRKLLEDKIHNFPIVATFNQTARYFDML